jgi:hypothetical protein
MQSAASLYPQKRTTTVTIKEHTATYFLLAKNRHKKKVDRHIEIQKSAEERLGYERKSCQLGGKNPCYVACCQSAVRLIKIIKVHQGLILSAYYQ